MPDPIEFPPPDPPTPVPATAGPERWARCITCGYALVGLGEQGVCPECGRGFSICNPSTWTFKPPFAFWPFWLPGTIAAIATGVGGLAFGAVMGLGGWSLWLGVPTFAACLLGYGVRVRVPWLVLLGLVLVGGLLTAMLSLSLGGAFCGMIFAAVMLTPIAVGITVGAIVRLAIRDARWFDQRGYLPVLLFLSGMIGCQLLERATSGPGPTITIATSRVIAATPEVCWSHLRFYEEIDHPPPWILRIGLVRPERTFGSSARVGDTRVCIYNRGRLVKQVTRVESAQLLEFQVTEQHIGYERDVALRSGSFHFCALPNEPGRTRVTLTTTYQAKLGPRWAWGWGERWAMRTLHGHVLEGLARRSELASNPTASPEVAEHTGRTAHIGSTAPDASSRSMLLAEQP